MSASLAGGLVLVLAGGALGGALRFAVARWLARALGEAFPWGTLAVNLTGAFAIGALAGALGAQEDAARLALLVGLSGSYTTVSALAVDWLAQLRSGRPGRAVAYLAVSVPAGLAAAGLGLWLASP